MQLADLNSKPHGRKSSGISYTARLDPTSIILQGYNTTEFFDFIRYMDPLTSMTTTRIIMRRHLQEYNDALQNPCKYPM